MSETGSADVRQFTVKPDDEGIRLDRWFKRHLPQIGFATVSRWARTGQIRVDGKRAKVDDRLAAGQQLRVPPGGEPTERKPREQRVLSEDEIVRAEDMVITQDRAAIVLNKPPGLATQGGTGTKEHVDGLLDAFVRPSAKGDEPRPRLVHRLDKDTSGVLLVARTPGSAAFFSKRFAGRSAKKVYWALVVGVPDALEGTIEAPLAKQPGTGGEKMWVDEENGQAAKTRFRVIERAAKRAAWVELQPLTGRTHQLRVHMAAIGHPIVGDGKYGGQDAFLTGSVSRKMHLHARRLVIDHPDGTKLDVTAELPDHFASSMDHLGFDMTLSDALPDETPFRPGRVEKKQEAKAHAKQYRKERRGERRKRAEGPVGRTPTGKRAEPAAKGKAPGKAAGRPAARSAGKPAGKPAGRPAGKGSGKPAGGKPKPRGRP
ncbi:MAG: RluA family pseudouridine synthase [Candidatus Andeanibacterium colombiense]|uniref:Ribosomal large subunit pseudouridine synthase D n=1 Tax=Candidatus Andeanibacterium colombiense TaxID=3121345 RepID=A0AAJ5X8Q0_9SPHN|nr:MAG: RluA family pseudouridine synthase [Sphingomonadaceae bacterium]